MPLARLRQGQHTGGSFTLPRALLEPWMPLSPLAEPAKNLEYYKDPLIIAARLMLWLEGSLISTPQEQFLPSRR